MIKTKAKGSAAERELVHKFWAAGWACIRAAGSGSQQNPSPDILAGNRIRKIAIECKAEHSISKYIPKSEIEQLSEFSQVFGAEPWIAIRFDTLGWFFLAIDDLNESEKGYSTDLMNAKAKGLSFEELTERN